MQKNIGFFLISSGGLGGLWRYFMRLIQDLSTAEAKLCCFYHCSDAVSDRQMRSQLTAAGVAILDVDAFGILQTPGAAPAQPASMPCASPSKTRLRSKLFPAPLKSAVYQIRSEKRLAACLQELKLDAVHFLLGWYPSYLVPILAAKRAQIPIRLLDFHCQPYACPGYFNPVEKMKISAATRSATHIRALSGSHAELIAKFFPYMRKKISVIHNGVDAAALANAEASPVYGHDGRQIDLNSRTVFVMIGKLTDSKGFRDLIQAVQRLDRKQLENVLFLLVGEGENKAIYQSLIHESGLSEHMILTGYRQDAAALLAQADGFLLLSHHEGFPVTLMEAAALGIPALCTNVGSAQEIMARCCVAEPIQPGSIQEIVDALRAFLSGLTQPKKRLPEVRDFMTRYYSAASVNQKILQIYNCSERTGAAV